MGVTQKARVSIVLGTFNRHAFLKAAISSIRSSDLNIPFEIIVVDGGSTDGTLAWLAQQMDIITIIQHNRVFVGGEIQRKRNWGYFMNLGFKAAEGELICMISDDSVVHPDTLARGIERYYVCVNEGRKIGGVAFYWRSWPQEASYRVGLTLGDNMFVNHGLYNKAALEEVGFLDEDTYKFYCADGDVCLRMWQAGYEIVAAPDAFVEHYEEASSEVRTGNYATVERDWAAYVKRWDRIYFDPANPCPGQFLRSDVPVRDAAHLFPSVVSNERLSVIDGKNKNLTSQPRRKCWSKYFKH